MPITTRNVILDFDVKSADAKSKLDALAKELADVEKQFKEATVGSLEFYEAEKKLTQLNAQLGNSLQDTGKKANNFKTSMSGAASAVKQLVAFAGISTIVANAGKTIIDFDQTLADLSAITGATGGDLDFLAEKAREFGRTTTVSAIDAAEAFKLIGSAKPELLQNGEALAAVTREAITLSEASGIDLPQAAEQLGSALNAMNLPASEAGRVINVLAAASQKGSREIPFVNEALSKFGGVAAQAGESIETSVAAVELLGKVIPEASTAGTNLRGIFIKLQTAAAAQNREYKGLANELDFYGDKVKDVTFLKTTFGEENLLAIQTLIAERDQLRGFTEDITGTNTAMEQANIRTATVSGALSRLGNAWQDIVLRFRTGSGALTRVLLFLADNLGTIVKVVGSLAAGILAYNAAVTIVNIAQRAYTATTIALRIAKVALTQGLGAATKGMQLFNATTRANPIGAIIGVVTTAVALFWDWGEATGAAAEGQKELNEEVLRGQQIQANTQDIAKQAGALSQFNKDQTKAFLDRVNQELASTESKSARLIAIEEQTGGAREIIADSYSKRLQAINDRIADIDGDPTRQNELNNLIDQRVALRREEAKALRSIPTVTGQQKSEEGITTTVLEEQKKRLELYKVEAEERLKGFKNTEEGFSDAIKKGTIKALQEEVKGLRDQVTDEFVVGSDQFATGVEKYIAKSKELEEAQKALRESTETNKPAEGSIKFLSAAVQELQQAVESTNLADPNFDQLVTNLQAAEEKLKAARARIKDSTGVDPTTGQIDDLQEAERNQAALLQIAEEGEIKLLDLKLAFARARLQILQDSGKAETDEYQKQLNQIEELEATRNKAVQDAADEELDIQREKNQAIVDGIANVVSEAISATSQLVAIQEAQLNEVIDLQRQKVEEAKQIAEEGNAELLELEESRLNELNKKREQFVRRQQALAAIQLVAESSLAIAKSAAEGGAAAPFTIAATLIALAAGLAQAKALAQQSSFFKGGYTGDGNPRDVSTALGRKPYEYHKAEFVMDHQVTRIGNNRRWFDWMLKGRVNLDQVMGGNVVIQAPDNSKKLDELIEAVRQKPVPSWKFDKRGIITTIHTHERNARRIKSKL